tara:strand:+ start:5630 stop:6088 length:459 start_codon:yes stop_codon:yes gene_type:complete
MNRYLNRTNVVLLLITAVCFTLASCAGTAEFVAGAAAISGGAIAILDAAAPFMTPEQFGDFRNGVEGIDSTVEATKSVLTVLGDAFANFRDAVQARDVAQTSVINDQAATIGNMPGRAEVAAWGVGGGSGGTALSRVLSAFKHAQKPAAAPV